MLCTALPDGWLSWGAFCDARAHPLKDKNDPEYGAVDATWLDHSVTAYLQVSHALPVMQQTGICMELSCRTNP